MNLMKSSVYIYMLSYVYIYVCYTDWWFQTCFIFHFIYGIILPIDALMFFKMVKTTNQI
jgi:hypothetical protein